MSNLIRLTVEPHVQTYVQHLFGPQLILSDDNVITLLLKRVMEPFDKLDPGKVRPCRKHDLGGWIDVYVSDGMLRKYGGFISNENIKGFSRTMDTIIKQEMYRWCHHPNRPDNFVDYNIRRFIDYYEFSEDDLTFDNLKRWYYRERQRLDKRKGEIKDTVLTIPMMLHEAIVSNKQIALF
ncbi:hypothetical protein FAZ19_19765 [Sphingobacterium alkalisoli]|uniref:Uncharacterized protein n=1 Tax=Sphingobacterium alkalisoli TaxID=1874115 RepID=A0A4U0GUP6_9SPHI|nr:hypothetical protein [Sphingobacterium alkalisoli]TJY62708.1 hypothetical protein FAZ19_19765 [Sphingobacterium alkalisoli]GGH28348.1 hypothetical protein GCM10011418_38940 [Sphingobacterium alkalisoli]